jgi:glucokinase
MSLVGDNSAVLKVRSTERQSEPLVLMGDIGATNARFASLTGGHLGEVHTSEVARFASFEELLKHALEYHFPSCAFTNALLALAGPIENGRCVLTNTSWVVDPRDLKSSFGFDVQIVNDFQAVAYALPTLTSTDVERIGGGEAKGHAPKAVVGPGSGMGVACLLEVEKELLVVPSEGGHSTLAGGSDREDHILRTIRERFGHVSSERALSGPGLENIFQAISCLDERRVISIDAAEITRRAMMGECAIAHEALSVFCALLGSFAGNIALTFGARGGMYIAGGISPRIVEFLIQSEFRQRFEAKGRFRNYLENIPCYVIVHPATAFLGLKNFMKRQSKKGAVSEERGASGMLK